MTRDEAKAALEEGKTLTYGAWTWTSDAHGTNARCCHSEDNCCFEVFKNIEEMLDDIGDFSDWEEIEVDE